MSSILRALKKLEDKAQQRNDNEGRSQGIDTKEVIIKPLKRSRLFYRLLSTSLFLVLIVIVGWLLLSQKPLFTKETSLTSIHPESSTPPFHKRPKVILQPVEIKKTPLTTSQRQLEERSAKPELSKKTVYTKRNGKSPKKSPDKKEPVTTRKHIPIIPSGNSTLDLQAIAWSKDPQKRIAVINGHIVREGESIGDMSVTHIGADNVLVRKGGTEQKLLFKLR